MSICKNIKKIRNNIGITQAELAARVGITNSMLSQIERGRSTCQ